MQQCEFCHEYKLEENAVLSRHQPKRKLLFPDGRKIQWSYVCWDCVKKQQEWEQQRDIEKFQEAERRRQWHKEVAERREQARIEADAKYVQRVMDQKARGERQRELDLAKMANIEAQMAMLQNSLDKLRKKYSPSDDKNT